MFGFEKNEGDIDRAARIIAGVILIVAAYLRYVVSPLDIILYIVGAILLFTGITGFCALYKLLGLKTN
ncbi:MAG: DUF2892 domain-containing protein [Candidatus Bilamarchaeaceae archaeon]